MYEVQPEYCSYIVVVVWFVYVLVADIRMSSPYVTSTVVSDHCSQLRCTNVIISLDIDIGKPSWARIKRRTNEPCEVVGERSKVSGVSRY